ncbi:Histidine kinase [Burkholderiales bacterium 8X]|nr:Histidine kinase [Burkholderiales bacterium 8X]
MQLQHRPSTSNPLHDRLFAGLQDEPLTFLTSSAGLVRLIDRASRDDCTIEDAVKLVHNEPLVAAKMVAMANSAAYKRPNDDGAVTSVKVALGLLGLDMLKAVAGAVMVGQLTAKAANVNGPTVARLWAHSIEVAALAAVISRSFTKDPPETALFTGIVHEIAGFYILSKSTELVDLTGGNMVAAVAQDAARQEEASASVMAVGTRRLLAALKVPDEVSQAIEGQWRGYLKLPPETLGDTLMVANLMATTPNPFDPPGLAGSGNLDLEEVLNQSEVTAVIREAYDQVRAIQQAFNPRPA